MIEADFAHVIGTGKRWKLTGMQVVKIYLRARKVGANVEVIAREFGVHSSIVRKIKYGELPGYKEIIDTARRIGMLKTSEPEPKTVDDIDDAPSPKSKLFRGHPKDSILRHALLPGDRPRPSTRG